MVVARTLTLGVITALLFAIAAPPASADNVNSLYLVLSEQPSFGNYYGGGGDYGGPYLSEGPALFAGDSFGPRYTLVNFLTFTGGTFPGDLRATVHTGLFAEAGLNMADYAGHEFFFMGFFQGHLMLGAASIPGNFPNPLNDAWETGVINGVRTFSGLAPTLGMAGGVASVSADAFWNWFVGETGFGAADYADLINRTGAFVGWQVYASLDASGSGSENVFGFTDPQLTGVASVGQTQGGDSTGTWQRTNQPVPEPGTMLLVAAAAVGGLLRRRKN